MVWFSNGGLKTGQKMSVLWLKFPVSEFPTLITGSNYLKIKQKRVHEAEYSPPLHGPACPSTKNPIRPHPTVERWHYTILLLNDNCKFDFFFSWRMIVSKPSSPTTDSRWTNQKRPTDFWLR